MREPAGPLFGKPSASVKFGGMEHNRQAMTAAQSAIEALGRRDAGAARMAISVAVDRDEAELFARLADAVFLAATELEETEEISDSTWNQLGDAVGPGPLLSLVEQVRG